MQTDFQGKSRGCPARRVCRAVGGNARPGHPIQLQPEGLLQLCVPAGELCLNFLLSAFCKSCSSVCWDRGWLFAGCFPPPWSIHPRGRLPSPDTRSEAAAELHPAPSASTHLAPIHTLQGPEMPLPDEPNTTPCVPKVSWPPPTNSRIQPASLLQHRVGAAWETTPLTASLLHRVAFSPAPFLPSQACPAPLKK